LTNSYACTFYPFFLDEKRKKPRAALALAVAQKSRL
jgi:hypothetical protein